MTATEHPAAPAVDVAIIGGGLMGREIAAALRRWPALIDHPVRPRLVGVADVNPAALEHFAGDPDVRLLVTDYRELLADDAVDVVYVAVRHDLHEQIYSDVIAAGKDLLAEKPFGIDGEAAAAILETMSRHPESFVRCSSEMPYFPGAQRAIDHVRSGAIGRILEVRSSFLHSSDLDVNKPLTWKRRAALCGRAGVMNDLGLHAWHVPLRLGWRPSRLSAVLQDIVTQRPGPDGALEPCDTWDNAVIHAWVPGPGDDDAAREAAGFPMTVETKRIAPGHKNSWELEVLGMDGGVRFTTKRPKTVEVFGVQELAGIGREQTWSAMDAGSSSAWPTVTGGIFETGFSDAILQMWAAFLAERAGALGEAFGPARPEEAAFTHVLYDAAIRSHESRASVDV